MDVKACNCCMKDKGIIKIIGNRKIIGRGKIMQSTFLKIKVKL